MEKKTLVTTASPLNAPSLEGNILSYITQEDNAFFLVNVDMETMELRSSPIEWNFVNGLSMCETVADKFYYSEPMLGVVKMIQPNGVNCIAATFNPELAQLVTRTLFQRPALTMKAHGLATLSGTFIGEGNVVQESVLEDNIVVPKGVYAYNTVGYYNDVYYFEERCTNTGSVSLAYVKNGRVVRMPTKFQGYLPTKDGLLGYKLVDGAVSHLCMLTYEVLDKAFNGDVRDLKRATKLKFNAKGVFGQHGCGVIPHVDVEQGLQFAGLVGEQGTHIMQGTKIVTVAQPLPEGVVVTKGDQVVAIQVVNTQAGETFDPQAPMPANDAQDW